jgi:hypothetical protein
VQVLVGVVEIWFTIKVKDNWEPYPVLCFEAPMVQEEDFGLGKIRLLGAS